MTCPLLTKTLAPTSEMSSMRQSTLCMPSGETAKARNCAFFRTGLRRSAVAWVIRTTSCTFRRRLSDSLLLGGIAQHVAAAPNGFYVVFAVAGNHELLEQLADKDVDDLKLGLIHAAIKMIEEHLVGQLRAFAKRVRLQHLIFLS